MPSVKPSDTCPLIEPLLSLEDFARLLNVSRRTAERLLAAGKLPKADLRIGRMPRWQPDTVRHAMKGGLS